MSERDVCTTDAGRAELAAKMVDFCRTLPERTAREWDQIDYRADEMIDCEAGITPRQWIARRDGWHKAAQGHAAASVEAMARGSRDDAEASGTHARDAIQRADYCQRCAVRRCAVQRYEDRPSTADRHQH